MGDKYGLAISKSVGNLKHRKVNLKNNRLKARGVSVIIDNLTEKSQKLNLSNNRIGDGITSLARSLEERPSLIHLNLEGNLLGDTRVDKLLSAVLNGNQGLKMLNLRKNQISDKSKTKLIELGESDRLHELYLGWNSLTFRTGGPLFQVLKDSENLRVLDLGSNFLGRHSKDIKKMVKFEAVKDKKGKQGKKRVESLLVSSKLEVLESFLAENKSLLHLDLSNNEFDLEDSIKIKESLDKNHTIYGFHFQGNYGFCDILGHLKMEEGQIIMDIDS